MEEQSPFFSRWKLSSFSQDKTTEYQHAASGKPSLGVRTLLCRRERTVARTNQSAKETTWFQCQYLSDFDARPAGKVEFFYLVFEAVHVFLMSSVTIPKIFFPQTLSCLLQTLLTGPYSVMPSNVASPQVHLIMHQLNQCYTQLTWQQNNVQR